MPLSSLLELSCRPRDPNGWRWRLLTAAGDCHLWYGWISLSGMILRHSRNGGRLQLWWVELVPKRTKTFQEEAKEALRLAGGMPKNEIRAFSWMLQVLEGVRDHREPHCARVCQRLVVFTDRKAAARRARKETNEFWTGKVRRVRVVEGS